MEILNKCRKCSTDLVLGENITQARIKNQDWLCKLCSNIVASKSVKKRRDKLRTESQAGVYGCYLEGELVYVGESQYCESRWDAHLYTSPNSKSSIGLDLTRRKDYEWKILKLEENIHKRRAIEMELIVTHKPPLNYPYRVILAMED